ncbi:hypothetical protein BTO22_13055 [Aliivibrio sifiae]|uniref:DUF4145 domain-containing protein n=1 Tax=Aliivibrio sifiae TaxID=566293 RepID=A0A2S7X5E5_9GAMM|nr:hypothetical protein BTO22_13055 [Aliivibrio sifiae]
MEPFTNEKFNILMSDLIQDAFYVKGRPNRGRIATIRQISEVIIRKILNYSQEEFVTLGNHKVSEELKLSGNEHPLLNEAIKYIKKHGNDCSHTQLILDVSDEALAKAEEHLFNLYSYIFFNFFKKNTFGSNDEIMRLFSALPPKVRYTTLRTLYESYDSHNVNVIDKLVLSMLKAFGEKKAMDWIFDNEVKLLVLDTSGITRGSIGNHQNMYDLCLERVAEVSNVIKRNGPLYKSFEQATEFYKSLDRLSSNSPENIEFNSLMDFAYLGRLSETNPRLDKISEYFIVG